MTTTTVSYRQASRHRRMHAVAREAVGAYGTGGQLETAVDAVVATDLDALDDEQVRVRLRQVQRAIDRLGGFRTKAAGALESRALRAAGPGREQAALRTVRDGLVDQLRLTPAQVKQAGQTGRRLAGSPAAQAALTGGQLPAEHARLLADTLHPLSGPVRDQVETDLLAAARSQDARSFGRTCRRTLAAADADATEAAHDRRHARRYLRVTDTADGMVAIHGHGTGLDGEIVLTALHTFRRPTATGEHRSPEQTNWDALVHICTTALDVGVAPANRRVRPHLLITIPEHLISNRTDGGAAGGTTRGGDGTTDGDATGGGGVGGVAEAAWTGPLPWSQVRRLLADAEVSRLLIDAAGLPLEASAGVRNVPAGLWKALQVRDRTCIADGCTIPAAWCQVMHLGVPYRLDGRLTLDTAAPGCSHHHKLLDHHGWQITWIDRRPILHHPDRPPRAGPHSDSDTDTDARAGPDP